MKILNFKNNIYNVPEKWCELNVGKYQKLAKLKLTDDIETRIKMLSILSDIPEEELYAVSAVQEMEVAKLCDFLYNEVQEPHKFELTIKGIKYRMDENIINYSTRAYIDLDRIVNDTEHSVDNLHYSLAIIYRPVNNKGEIEVYNDASLDERAAIFQEYMSCNYAVSAMIFFSKYAQILLDTIQNSLKKEAKMLTK